ncbi:site-specific integrase [Leuconostoc mesenteroides]|uniref:site-specific integrase n=1 Tax=Leuconostoc mesenteroides TaxID=1245 RepID=UPI0023625F1A|nr:site-specific integrase [Leuconostoc mesenteroides]
MASIFKTDAGTYRVKVSIPINGKYKQKTKSGFKNKTEARAWATQIEAKKLDDDEQNYSDELLVDYFKRWVSIYKTDTAPATLFQYRTTEHVIKKYLPTMRLADFDRSDFQKFVNEYGSNHSKETVNKRRVHIAQSLKDAYAEGMIKRDPTIRVKTVGLDGKDSSMKFLEFDEMKKLEEYAYDHYLENDVFLAMIISIHTGLRFGEVAALRQSDIDYKNKELSVTKSLDMFRNEREPKTKNSIRTIKVDDTLLKILKNIKTKKDEYIINSNAQRVTRFLHVTIKELGIKDVTFHALRHSHASYLISRGVAIQYVSERLGHADVSITQQVYSHLLNSLRVKEESKAISLLDDI